EDPSIQEQNALLAPGNYTVSVADSQGCSTTVENIDVPSITSTQNPVMAGLKVYPNPAQNHIWIKSEQDKTLDINLISSTGQVIKAYHLQLKANLPHLLNISELGPGVYVMKILDRENTHAIRVIKSL
ncbi:T9SS type A sorting domain-containing protein, partial [Fulvivirga sediminis]